MFDTSKVCKNFYERLIVAVELSNGEENLEKAFETVKKVSDELLADYVWLCRTKISLCEARELALECLGMSLSEEEYTKYSEKMIKKYSKILGNR